MTQPVRTYRKSLDKEANTMASKEVEVLDPAATVEKDKETVSQVALDRRYFMAALGVAGAAAGAALLSTPSTVHAQQPIPNGYTQLDILNFLLNIKYLKATLYSYLTQGADLPAASGVTVGTGGVFNAPAKLAFSGTNAAQITDIFNEMYYDELNQLIALRGLIGTSASGRGTMNLLGTGSTTTATSTMTQNQAIGIARFLEDVSVSAFAYASEYLTGNNLTYASQAMAVNGFHAGAVRLVCIQNNVPYLSPFDLAPNSTSASGTVNTFTAGTTSGNPLIYTMAPANPVVVGDLLTGTGLPVGVSVAAVSPASNATFTAISNKTTTPTILTGVSSVAGLLPGQPITGTGIPALTIITAVGTNTVTMSNAATVSSVVAPTGLVAQGSNIVTSVSSTSGVVVGASITGTGIPTGATVTALSSSNATITFSGNPATATSTATATPTGALVNGSPIISYLSSVTNLNAGQTITGTGIPSGTTILSVNSSALTLVMSANANATTNLSLGAATATPAGILTAGNNVIASVASTTGVAAGQAIIGANIPPGTIVSSVTASAGTITMSNPATGSSVVTTVATPTVTVTAASPILTAVSSFTGVAVGLPIFGNNLPAGAWITAFSATAGTITINAAATGSLVVETVTITQAQSVSCFKTTALSSLNPAVAETITISTIETVTVGVGTVTLTAPATATGGTTILMLTADSQDVAPADPGTAALAAAGPAAITGSSPTVYQGFFDTAGSGTATANTPAGFTFARTFSQVLTVLYGSTTPSTYQGGFFPNGVAGSINVV
jgi:hypothetical protein